MPVSKKPEVSKQLLLGDYITVSAPNLEKSELDRGEVCLQVGREVFVQRARKQRGELFQEVQKQSGKLIDVRERVVA